MEDDRRETQRRASPRKRTLKKGRIVFNNRRSVIDCTVRNLSDGGALLLVNSLIGIPDSFDLTIDSDSTTFAAKLMWKRENQLGVKFE
jgi:PilZ domain